MKDADARERLDRLEQAFTTLPAVISETVLKELESVIKRFNDAADKYEDMVEAFTAAESNIDKVAKHVGGHSELLEVLESDVNAVRVDANAAIAAAGEATSLVKELVTALAAVQKVGARP